MGSKSPPPMPAMANFADLISHSIPPAKYHSATLSIVERAASLGLLDSSAFTDLPAADYLNEAFRSASPPNPALSSAAVESYVRDLLLTDDDVSADLAILAIELESRRRGFIEESLQAARSELDDARQRCVECELKLREYTASNSTAETVAATRALDTAKACGEKVHSLLDLMGPALLSADAIVREVIDSLGPQVLSESAAGEFSGASTREAIQRLRLAAEDACMGPVDLVLGAVQEAEQLVDAVVDGEVYDDSLSEERGGQTEIVGDDSKIDSMGDRMDDMQADGGAHDAVSTASSSDASVIIHEVASSVTGDEQTTRGDSPTRLFTIQTTPSIAASGTATENSGAGSPAPQGSTPLRSPSKAHARFVSSARGSPPRSLSKSSPRTVLPTSLARTAVRAACAAALESVAASESALRDVLTAAADSLGTTGDSDWMLDPAVSETMNSVEQAIVHACEQLAHASAACSSVDDAECLQAMAAAAAVQPAVDRVAQAITKMRAPDVLQEEALDPSEADTLAVAPASAQSPVRLSSPQKRAKQSSGEAADTEAADTSVISVDYVARLDTAQEALTEVLRLRELEGLGGHAKLTAAVQAAEAALDTAFAAALCEDSVTDLGDLGSAVDAACQSIEECCGLLQELQRLRSTGLALVKHLRSAVHEVRGIITTHERVLAACASFSGDSAAVHGDHTRSDEDFVDRCLAVMLQPAAEGAEVLPQLLAGDGRSVHIAPASLQRFIDAAGTALSTARVSLSDIHGWALSFSREQGLSLEANVASAVSGLTTPLPAAPKVRVDSSTVLDRAHGAVKAIEARATGLRRSLAAVGMMRRSAEQRAAVCASARRHRLMSAAALRLIGCAEGMLLDERASALLRSADDSLEAFLSAGPGDDGEAQGNLEHQLLDLLRQLAQAASLTAAAFPSFSAPIALPEVARDASPGSLQKDDAYATSAPRHAPVVPAGMPVPVASTPASPHRRSATTSPQQQLPTPQAVSSSANQSSVASPVHNLSLEDLAASGNDSSDTEDGALGKRETRHVFTVTPMSHHTRGLPSDVHPVRPARAHSPVVLPPKRAAYSPLKQASPPRVISPSPHPVRLVGTPPSTATRLSGSMTRVSVSAILAQSVLALPHQPISTESPPASLTAEALPPISTSSESTVPTEEAVTASRRPWTGSVYERLAADTQRRTRKGPSDGDVTPATSKTPRTVWPTAEHTSSDGAAVPNRSVSARWARVLSVVPLAPAPVPARTRPPGAVPAFVRERGAREGRRFGGFL